MSYFLQFQGGRDIRLWFHMSRKQSVFLPDQSGPEGRSEIKCFDWLGSFFIPSNKAKTQSVNGFGSHLMLGQRKSFPPTALIHIPTILSPSLPGLVATCRTRLCWMPMTASVTTRVTAAHTSTTRSVPPLARSGTTGTLSHDMILSYRYEG